eukprot:TRINITY_DN3666_c0_g2_i2.p3 TRINITY_DN3666_c0_g2~~TRINITY_DN3666_c0_g2_i2.p3  ORF type:complete len:115 (+),score=19.28 TRINITY_DN3666_c0_g2_i2:391-735(+)
MAVYTLALDLVVCLLKDNTDCTTILEAFATITEVLIGVPQFCQNYTTDCTEGLSPIPIFIWMIKDFLKTFYNSLRGESVQALLAPAFRLIVDISILLQIFIYESEKTVALHKEE